MIFDPPFNATSAPEVALESPANGQHVQDILTVSGVDTDSGLAARSVDIFIDGVERSRVTSGSANGSFSAILDLPSLGLQTGDHTLTVRALNNRGAITDFPNPGLTFTMDPGHASLPVAAIELPVGGAPVSGTLSIKGYAYDASLRITAVDTLIDGVVRSSTTYGTARNDICAPLGNAPPNCPGVGFSGLFSTVGALPPLPDGPHALEIRIRDQSGRFTFYPENPIAITIHNGGLPRLVGVLESPVSNARLSGTVSVSGYMYVPTGKVLQGFLRVDGVSYGSVTLGLPRPDVCSTLPDADACPNIGFTATLDTTRLLDGPHILGIAVLAEGLGNAVTFPSVVNGGINIFTRN